MNASYKANYFLGDGKFELKNVAIRELKAGEVLVRVKAAGVCGTDVHIYHGEEGATEVNPPVVLGHEYAGVVEAIGEGVTAVKVGDHVTIDPNMYCGMCPACREGRKQFCDHMEALGVNYDGGFAEYCIAPQAQCLVLDEKVPFEVGAMAEPIACCLHGIDLANIRVGDAVLVVGGGAIGQIMAQLARLAGAARVIVSEPVAARREIAMQLGADGAIDPINEDVRARFDELTGRNGASVVIECVGHVAATKQAVDAATRGATVLLFSVPNPKAKFELPLIDVFKKELTIRGSFVNPDTHSRAVELLNAGCLNLEPVITHRFPVEQVEDAIKAQMGSESIKVLVTP